MAQQTVNTTDTPNAGRTKWNANDSELYALASTQAFNVREYGATGGGWDTRVADQQGHADAFAAANAATWGGIVYTPPGEYYLTGNFTQGKRVGWHGAGVGRTTFSHYDTATALVTSLADGNSDGEYPQRGWRGFRLWGNSSASAKAIVFGNTTFPYLESVTISGYTGSTAVEMNNTINFTENVRIYGVQIYNCLRCLDIVAYANPRHSFGGISLDNSIFNPQVPNGIGIRVGANAYIYGSTLRARFVGEYASATCLDVNGTATIKDSLFMLNFEGLPVSGQANGGIGLRLRTPATMTGKGILGLEGSISHDIQSGTTYNVT